MVRIPGKWTSWPCFNESIAPTNLIVCELDKKFVEFQLWWKETLIFVYSLSLLSRGTVGVLFFRPSGDPYIGFWCLLVVLKCLVDIWKRVYKKSEASDAFSFWFFFGMNEITFFSNSLFLSSNFSFLINFCALKVSKRPYIVVIRHSLNSRSRKEGNERFWKMKNGAR